MTIKELNDRLNSVNSELNLIEQKHQVELNHVLNEKEGSSFAFNYLNPLTQGYIQNLN